MTNVQLREVEAYCIRERRHLIFYVTACKALKFFVASRVLEIVVQTAPIKGRRGRLEFDVFRRKVYPRHVGVAKLSARRESVFESEICISPAAHDTYNDILLYTGMTCVDFFAGSQSASACL